MRERVADIEPLLDHFVAEFAQKLNKPVSGVDKETVKMLKGYSFPGNVRELRNMTERAIILCKGETLTVMDFQTRIGIEPESHKEKVYFNLEENESNLIRLALKLKNYNQIKAAEILGITRDSLIRRMKKYNIYVNKMDNPPSEN